LASDPYPRVEEFFLKLKLPLPFFPFFFLALGFSAFELPRVGGGGVRGGGVFGVFWVSIRNSCQTVPLLEPFSPDKTESFFPGHVSRSLLHIAFFLSDGPKAKKPGQYSAAKPSTHK